MIRAVEHHVSRDFVAADHDWHPRIEARVPELRQFVRKLMIGRMRPADRAQPVIDPRIDRRGHQQDQRERRGDDAGPRDRAARHERFGRDQQGQRHQEEQRVAPIEPQVAAEHQRCQWRREHQHRADHEHEECVGIFGGGGIQRTPPGPQ